MIKILCRIILAECVVLMYNVECVLKEEARMVIRRL